MLHVPEFKAARPVARQPMAWYRGEGGGRIHPPEEAENAETSAVVSRNELGSTGEFFAIKSLSRHFLENGDKGKAALEAEVNIHRRMSPPAVPALRDVVHDPETGQVHLVFDYTGPPILDAVDAGATPEAAARNGDLAADATLSLLTALYELHGAGYCYTDMRPQQMLWDASREAEEFRAKLADFGAVTKISSGVMPACTFAYMAPEGHAILARGISCDGISSPAGIPSVLGPACDAWGAVLTICTIALGGVNPFLPPWYAAGVGPEPYPSITGCPWNPYNAKMVLEDPTAYERAFGWELLDPDLQEFIRFGLDPNPKERPTIEQLACTAWGRRCFQMMYLSAADADDSACASDAAADGACVGGDEGISRDEAPSDLREASHEERPAVPPMTTQQQGDAEHDGPVMRAAPPLVAAEGAEPRASMQCSTSNAQQPVARQIELLQAQAAVGERALAGSSQPAARSSATAAAAVLPPAAELEVVWSERANNDALRQLADERREDRDRAERLDQRMDEMIEQLKALTALVAGMQADSAAASSKHPLGGRLLSGDGSSCTASDVGTPSGSAGAGPARMSRGGGSRRSGGGSRRSLHSSISSCSGSAEGACKSTGKNAGARVLNQMWGDVKAAGRAVAGWFEQALARPSGMKVCSRAAPTDAVAAAAAPKPRRFHSICSVMALV